jgi:hypothetical protein
MGFFRKVRQRVYALAYEVEPLRIPFAVQVFEFDTPLEEEFVCKKRLFLRDPSLIDNPDTSNQFAEVRVVWLGEDVVENTGSLAIQEIKVLPGFVTA